MAGWRLRQHGSDAAWLVVPPDGSPLEALLASTGADAPVYRTRRLALEALVAAALASEAGLLPDEWSSDAGIAFAAPTGPERDFTDVTWTYRDPATTLVPLMLQTVTAPGHDDAELAGFVSSLVVDAARTVHASGRFYDGEAGRAFRDILSGGRRYGVSVDPGENTAAEWICTSYDADGFCDAGRMSFTQYEIAGLTGTPFPGFERASIMLSSSTPLEAPAPAFAMAASVVAPSLVSGPLGRRVPSSSSSRSLRYQAPPALHYRRGEPDLDSGLLVEQEDGTYGVPLTIDDDGAVYGHVARWGQCHTGYPDSCVSAPQSRTQYAGFHLGLTRLDDGSDLPTGVLTAGCDHAAIRLRAPDAREHYDNSGTGWATVRALDGAYGIWVAGALRPDVTDEQADLLRSLSLSGDWRRDRGTDSLELLAILAVNVPGFPQRRQGALVASGVVSQPLAYWGADDELESLVASGITRRPSCGCGSSSSTAGRLEALEAQVEALTRLTVRR